MLFNKTYLYLAIVLSIAVTFGWLKWQLSNARAENKQLIAELAVADSDNVKYLASIDLQNTALDKLLAENKTTMLRVQAELAKAKNNTRAVQPTIVEVERRIVENVYTDCDSTVNRIKAEIAK
jgi:predicted negative regulator of RcsB-dependent stress response